MTCNVLDTMRLRLITLVLALTVAVPACAVVVDTAAAGRWNVELVEGSFAQNQARLTSQVWWGNKLLASEFALLVGPALGVHVDGTATLGDALFAYALLGGGSPRNASTRMLVTVGDPTVQLVTTGVGWDVLPSRYAVATAVTEPTVSMLFGAALLVPGARARTRRGPR
ncbi:MAG: hypothetical protein AB7Q81_04505 [Gammaproteobacteria bacterium]